MRFHHFGIAQKHQKLMFYQILRPLKNCRIKPSFFSLAASSSAFEIVVHFFLDFLSFLNLALLGLNFFWGRKFFGKSFDLAKHSPLTICFWDGNSLRPDPHTFCGLRHPVHIPAPVPGSSGLGHWQHHSNHRPNNGDWNCIPSDLVYILVLSGCAKEIKGPFTRPLDWYMYNKANKYIYMCIYILYIYIIYIYIYM